jgi:hypothetical protein
MLNRLLLNQCCGYGMNKPDYNIFPKRAQKRIFWVKILKLFDADPGSWMEKIPVYETFFSQA